MKHKFYAVIQQMTWIGYFLVAVFAVRTFDQAIPDQMYIEQGEDVSYDFHVPVSVTLAEDSEETSYSFTAQQKFYRNPSYTVTGKLFGIFPVKDVEVTLVDKQEVHASGEPIGIYVRTQGVLVLGTANVRDESGNECRPAQNLVRGGDYIVSVNGESV